MKALVYHGPTKISWDEVPMPKIIDQSDAIIKVDITTICGTDLHILKGDTPEVKEGRILGHEAVGTVHEVGTSVSNLKVGDRVLVSCVSACGSCRYCREMHFGQCLNGGPEGVADEEILMLADILPTAYEVGVINGKVQPGDVVAIIGAGPIGLSAILSSKLLSPSCIISIDLIDARLEAAKRFGADITINSSREDPLEIVRKLTEDLGVDVAIEAVGITDTFELATTLIRPGGHIANVGVHGKPATLHLETLWSKNVSITTGLVDTYSTPTLLKLTKNHQIEVDQFITHHFEMENMFDAYDTFARAGETGALKVVITQK